MTGIAIFLAGLLGGIMIGVVLMAALRIASDQP